jgi:dimethylargininase
MIDVSLAKAQHREYVSCIKESGVNVFELPVLEDFPDSVFAYDPGFLDVERCVIGRFGEKSRRGEEHALARDLADYKERVGGLNFVREPGTLEGGDILVTGQGIYIGESTRTNSNGIKQFAEIMKNAPVQSIGTKTFHMLCGCSYLSEGKMLIVPELLNPTLFPDFEHILVPLEESYASEALYLGERKVLIPAGFPRTAAKLRAAGYKPLDVDISEFYKGDGGISCLSQPIWKTP